MKKQIQRRDICVLTNGLSSAIRWRLDDYAQMLRAQLALLAAPEPFVLRTARPLPAAMLKRSSRTTHPQPR